MIKVVNETTGEGNTHYEFDLSNYASGVYMLTMITGGNRYIERVVKQ